MIHQLRNRNFYLMVLGDSVIFALSFYASYLFRFDFSIPGPYFEQFLNLLKYVIPIKLAVFFFFDLYKGMWRYTSLSDGWRLLEASFINSVILVTLILYKFGFHGFSRGIFLIDGLLTFIMTGGLRVSIRSMYSMRHTSKNDQPAGQGEGPAPAPRKNVLVVGAGWAGEKILREVKENPQLNTYITGFLDDDPKKKGRTIHGKPVLGSIEELRSVLNKQFVDEVFIAISTATGKQMRRIVDICADAQVNFKVLPGMSEIIDGKVGITTLRDVNYLDLLGREPVELNTAIIQHYITGKTVLVTGCGGSIGSELCRQIVRFKPGKLILVDSSEFNLHQIELELQQEHNFLSLVPHLGQVQDAAFLNMVFSTHKPDSVFHAAAYKHVPMVEKNPWAAVGNNIQGSLAVMEAAYRHAADRFVLVSTDKAVRPTNVMGASKRVTELIMRTFLGGKTRFMAVRFGNVVGSSGSVVPLFRAQIEKGGPVTVTHPEMTRYFMSISEAAQLILQAGAMGRGGEIFLLEMGAPVKIMDMARDLIRLSGKEPGEDIDIIFTGLRPGEKMYEELITEGEGIVRSDHNKILVLGASDQNASEEARAKSLFDKLDKLAEAAERHDAGAVRTILQTIVPEYRPS